MGYCGVGCVQVYWVDYLFVGEYDSTDCSIEVIRQVLRRLILQSHEGVGRDVWTCFQYLAVLFAWGALIEDHKEVVALNSYP
jgi:hypothetical protein